MFVFNFHFSQSLNNVLIPVPQPGEYTVVLSSDDEKYGGFGNVKMQTYSTKVFDGKHYIELYIPARTCFVLKEKVILAPAEEPKKTTRKRTTKKAAAEVTAPEVVAEEKPKRKRTTKKAAAEVAAPEAVTEEKPKRKRTTKKTSTEA